MKRSWPLAVILVWLTAGSGAVSGRAQAPQQPRIDARSVERLYNDTIVKDGNIDGLVKRLTTECRDAAKSKRARANACLLTSHLQWRHGRMPAAITAADEALAIDPYDEVVYHKARLFDATGRMAETRDWYQKALALTINTQLKETIRLRLTFVDAIDQNVKGLIDLARTRPVDFRNRAAIALGILDFSQEATEIYQVSGEGTERFRQQLRVAQWAIKGNKAPKAQEAAWQAVRAAAMDRDRRYALSLLVEAHTLDKSLDKLLAQFDAQKTLTADEEAIRIDLLRQTGQYQKAIDLFRSAHGGSLDPQMRLDLLRMYRDAGQDAAMIAEYRQLMAKDPAVIEWPEGLSQHYLEQGDRASARTVWEDFLGRNTEAGTLLLAAEAMTAFGLHDLALSATEKALAANPGTETAAQVRLAQFDLYRRRGDNADAEAALAALEKLLPGDSPYRSELADAYERLQKPQLAAKTLETMSAARGGLGTDDAMRLAWLLDSIGRRDDALKIWRDLWGRETLASRRRLIEDRLLLLAAETGTLGDLAVELEEKLSKGTAAPSDVGLLVSLYTKVGDSVSAIEVVTAAGKLGGRHATTEIATLKEQARIYLSLNEYDDFARVTRRLLEIDPAGKVDYLQSLLLNQIEAGADAAREPKDETAQLREYLAKLRQAGGSAVSTEFEAGVLDLAGFRDQAIDAYRRALALHPDRADDHLLLADLLRQAGRQAEAIASLQYITESAESDELFLIAIDGITNMRTGNVTQLKWAERRALERLTTRDDKLYLYEMLSDLAEEAKDIKMYLASLENSLAHADSRRSHVLRELLAATADVTNYEASQRTIRPDARLNVTYARRLIALGEELPPEVYIDLGRTFVKMNDPAAAMRAFNLAVDRTGRTSVVLDAAKLFERGGYEREAAGQYEKALVANSDSVETMGRLARLRERAGLLETANELYLRALVAVAGQQNRSVERGQERTPPSLDTLVTFEYRRSYQTLVTGFIATLPAAADARAARIRLLEDAFLAELAGVAGSSGTPAVPNLAYYPRLNVLAQTIRTTSYAVGVTAYADRADAMLLRTFGQDTRLVTQTTEQRQQWGYAPPAKPAAPAAAADRPMDTVDHLRAVGLALMRNDQDAALVAYRAWAKFGGLPKPPMFIGTIQLADRSPGIPEVAQHAFQRLDARHFGSLAQYIRDLVADQDVYAEKLILDLVYQYETIDVPILTRLEKEIGQPLIAEDRLMRLVNKQENWLELNLQYVLTHLPLNRQIDVLVRYSKANDNNWSRFLLSLGAILAKPLDQAQATNLLETLKPAMQNGLKKANGQSWLVNFMNYPFTAGVHPSNAPIVIELEEFLAEKYPMQFKVGYFKAALMRDIGRDQEALDAFVEAALKMYVPPPTENTIFTSGMPSPYAYQQFVRNFAPFVFPKYKADIRKLLDAREKSPAGLTEALISLRMELNNSDPGSDPTQFLADLQAMADRNPANEQLLNMLYPLYDQWGDTIKAIEVLGRLTELKPENRSYRYRLVQMWQKLDRPEKVVAALGTSTMEELSPVIPRNYYMESMSGPPAVRFPMLKNALDKIKAVRDGGDPQQAALGLRTLLQTLPPAGVSLNEFSQTRDPNDPYLYFRDLMMMDGENPPKPPAGTPPSAAAGAAAGAPAAPATVTVVQAGGTAVMTVRAAGEPAPLPPAGTPNIYDRLVTSLEATTAVTSTSTTPRPAKVMDVVVQQPYAIPELESYISTLRADDIDKQYVFYNFLIDAYVNNKRVDTELARRTPVIQSGTAGRKDVTLWLGLAAKQPADRAAELLTAADKGGVSIDTLGAFGRVLLARLYARAGRSEAALDAYTSVATSILAGAAGTIQPNTLYTDAYGRDNGLMLFTGLGLYEDARQHLDAAMTGQLVAAMLALAKPPASPTVEQAYARFVHVLYMRTLQANMTVPALRQAASELKPSTAWPRSEVLLAAFVRAHLGRLDEASALVQATLKRDLDVREPITAIVSNAMYASRQYQIALGLVGDMQLLGPFGTTGTGVEEFKPLFATKADAWPGASAWTSRIARDLPLWIERREINRDAGVQLLSLMAIRLKQIGDTAGVEAVSKSLSSALGGLVLLKSATLAIAATDKIGAPVDLAVAQNLVRANRLHVSRVVSAIARTDKEQGATQALALGAAAAEFTSNAELLKQLVGIAQASGATDDVKRWTDRQTEVAAARQRLSAKPNRTGGR